MTRPIPCGLVVRIRRSHRRGRGSIPRMGAFFFSFSLSFSSLLSLLLSSFPPFPPLLPPSPSFCLLQIECSVVARVFQSPLKNLPPNFTPPQQFHSPAQKLALLSSVQQLHAEVWVATIEASCVRIEIIDVIARVKKLNIFLLLLLFFLLFLLLLSIAVFQDLVTAVNNENHNCTCPVCGFGIHLCGS